jgi:hypothetical protein
MAPHLASFELQPQATVWRACLLQTRRQCCPSGALLLFLSSISLLETGKNSPQMDGDKPHVGMLRKMLRASVELVSSRLRARKKSAKVPHSAPATPSPRRRCEVTPVPPPSEAQMAEPPTRLTREKSGDSYDKQISLIKRELENIPSHFMDGVSGDFDSLQLAIDILKSDDKKQRANEIDELIHKLDGYMESIVDGMLVELSPLMLSSFLVFLFGRVLTVPCLVGSSMRELQSFRASNFIDPTQYR